MLIGLTLWGSAMLVTWLLAERKGRPRWFWVAWAFLFGWITVIVLAFMKPANESKRCPYCALRIPAEAVRCGHCQSDLSVS